MAFRQAGPGHVKTMQEGSQALRAIPGYNVHETVEEWVEQVTVAETPNLGQWLMYFKGLPTSPEGLYIKDDQGVEHLIGKTGPPGGASDAYSIMKDDAANTSNANGEDTFLFTTANSNLTITVSEGTPDQALFNVSMDLNDLDDVNAPSPGDQDALIWDNATGKWIPDGGATGALQNLFETVDVVSPAHGLGENIVASSPTDTLYLRCDAPFDMFVGGSPIGITWSLDWQPGDFQLQGDTFELEDSVLKSLRADDINVNANASNPHELSILGVNGISTDGDQASFAINISGASIQDDVAPQLTTISWEFKEDFAGKFPHDHPQMINNHQGIGSGTQQAGTLVSDNHFGVVKAITGTTAGGWSNFHSFINCLKMTGGEHFRAIIYIPTIANDMIIRCGFGDSANGTEPNDGVYFEATLVSGAGNWFVVSNDGGTKTSEDTGTAVAGGAWTVLELRMEDDYSSGDAFINNTNQTVTMGTNLPTSSTGIMFMVKNHLANTTSIEIGLDLIHAWNASLDRGGGFGE